MKPHRRAVEQLYDINKSLVAARNASYPLAESHHVTREDLLKNYRG
jgi:hypothetical protein